MPVPVLTTKLYVPQARQNIVVRTRLCERLEEGLQHKLTLVSAPAGFGKTTLLGEWCSRLPIPTAWLSLEAQDDNPARFLAYLIAAIQTVAPQLGENALAVLQAPQPPPPQAILTYLLNEIAAIPKPFVLVLDDYHLIEAAAIDEALLFLVEHLPPQMHLVIATREDPSLPLAQLRARDQLTELRAADLRFSFSEAADFLNRVMGLQLTAGDIAALEERTEGWVAGLQLAALAMTSNRTMPGQTDTASFIQSFTGSHRFVLDYLVEQVLKQQTAEIQNFLLCTSILERLCGPLCDAILQANTGTGSATLIELERANLFLFPLDNERRWYRYHHLFADLLRQRLPQHLALAHTDTASLHQRASAWYENNDLVVEAFFHAAAANDVPRAEDLIESGRLPFHSPGAVRMILDWLATLPPATLDAHPLLWVRSASLSLVIGITTGVDEKLQGAEAALRNTELDTQTRDLLGQIATAKATVAVTRYQFETVLVESKRALEFLSAGNATFRTSAFWAQGIAYFLVGERAASKQAFTRALTIAQASGNAFSTLLATLGLGLLQELDNQLDTAMKTYQDALRLAGEPALAIAYDGQLGMARILYERNDLDAAERHAESGLELAHQYDRVIDRYIVCEVFLARVQLARGNVDGAVAMLAGTEQSAREKNFVLRLPEIAAAQIPALVRRNHLDAAAQLAQTYHLPLGQARVLLAQGDAKAAWTVLETFRQFVETKGWADELLKTMVLQTVALDAQGKHDASLQLLGDALTLAEPSGFIRLLADEGEPMRRLLSEFQRHAPNHAHTDYITKLLAAFISAPDARVPSSATALPETEPLTEREREILQLIAQGYSNQDIGERLYLALSTIKGYNRTLFDKLDVKNRTEAVARARELGLI